MAVCSTIVGAPLFIYGFRHAQQVELCELELELKGLPPLFDGYRLVQVSDLHSKGLGPREQQVLKLLGGLQADVLALTGDYQYRNHTSANNLLPLLRQMAEIHDFPDGTVAIRGNHDRKELHGLLKKQTFMRYLNDEVVLIKRGEQTLALCGLGYARQEHARFLRSIRRLNSRIPPGVFKILLCHSPDAFPLARESGYRLMLAGDTHGGQLRLPILGAVHKKTSLPQRFCRGLNQLAGAWCYTSSGIGTTGMPCRFNCPPEITVFTLKAART